MMSDPPSLHRSTSSVLSDTTRKTLRIRRRGRNAVLTTHNYSVELFGPQLPVQVAESLAHSPGACNNATIEINPECEWAWYVYGRKLCVWHVSPSTEDVPPTVNCRDLLLPQSDLAHSANLVSIFVLPNKTTASCIAVSPEGLIRYWHVVGQHTPWIDVNAQLGGEEVCTLRYIPRVGCIGATTSASLFFIKPHFERNSPTVLVEPIFTSQGWLSGITRKVNSIFFGVNTGSLGIEQKFIKVLVSPKENQITHLFILTGLKLQLRVHNAVKNTTELIYTHDLEELCRSHFFTEDNTSYLNTREVLISDMRVSECGLTILASSSEPRNYMLLELPCHDLSPPNEAFKICSLSPKAISLFEEGTGKQEFLQFLMLPTTALIFCRKRVMAISMGGGTHEERLDIPGNVIGGHMFKTTPIFFSGCYGFVSVTPCDTSCFDLLNSSALDTAPQPKEITSREPKANASKDFVLTIKSAFILYARKNMVQCNYIIDKEFPKCKSDDLDSPFATTLMKVSLDLINERPLQDPRWGKATESAVSKINSLHIDTQLVEKQQAHDLLLRFLSDKPLVDRLGYVTKWGTRVKTITVLNEHNEKIVATLVVRKLYNKHSDVISPAISETVRKMGFFPDIKLSAQDFFYRYVSIVDEFMRCLVRRCLNAMSTLTVAHLVKAVLGTNFVLAEIVSAVVEKRDSRDPANADIDIDWMAIPGIRGINDYLVKMINITFKLLWYFREDEEDFKQLARSLMRLIDHVLYIKKSCSEGFVRLRTVILQACVSRRFLLEAKELAYKYKDFALLVDLCYRLDGGKDIYEIMETFGDEGVCLEVFKWHIRNQKKGDLVSLEVPPKYEWMLDAFLSHFRNIYWIYKVRKNDLESAAPSLTSLAIESKRNVMQAERMLTVSKLMSIIRGTVHGTERIEMRLKIIDVLKCLPEELLDTRSPNVGVLEPEEIIELLIRLEDDTDESYFMKALELVPFVEDDELQMRLRREIWVNAILKDDWFQTTNETPVEEISEMFLFRLIQLLLIKDPEHIHIIPTIDELLALEALKEHNENPVIPYLLKYAYEWTLDAFNMIVDNVMESEKED